MLEAKIQDQLEGNFKIAVRFRLDTHKHTCTRTPSMHARAHTCIHACMQLHFTDLGSCRVILHGAGIRASTVGQLGGGVSVCLRTLTGFDWGQACVRRCMYMRVCVPQCMSMHTHPRLHAY